MHVRTVMFDFWGTLAAAEPSQERFAARRRSLVQSWGLAELEPARIAAAMQQGMARAAAEICSAPYYLQRDMMALAYTYAAELAGGTLTSDTAALLAAHILPATLLDGHAREGAESTLAELRRRGYCLGIVSNIEEDDLSASVDALGLRSCFDFTLSSEAARSCKPDAEIFVRQSVSRATPRTKPFS